MDSFDSFGEVLVGLLFYAVLAPIILHAVLHYSSAAFCAQRRVVRVVIATGLVWTTIPLVMWVATALLNFMR